MSRFDASTSIPRPVGELYGYHAAPGAFDRLAPPWNDIRVLERPGGLDEGDTLVMELRAGPVGTRWVAQHGDHVPGRQFTDTQVSGPFGRWQHTHRFEADGDGASILRDEIDFALPLDPVGRLGVPVARRELRRMFAFRHRRTREDLIRHAEMGSPSLRIAVSGSTGMIGSALTAFLATGGHTVDRLVRPGSEREQAPVPAGEAVHWDPRTGELGARLVGADALVHLAGESLVSLRWTEAKREQIRASRVDATRRLCEHLAQMDRPPATLVCASAVGYYGDGGERWLDEDAPPGDDFLSDVCVEWEAATRAAREAGIRVVNLRIGVVLGAGGGMLALLAPLARLGLGGWIGDGRGWLPWIAQDDVVYAIARTITDPDLHGPVNAVSPRPVRRRAFAEALGRVQSRPAVFRVPEAPARLALGGIAGEAIASTRVRPAELSAAGHRWSFPELEDALRFELGR